MKKANGEYKEVIVMILEDRAVSKRVFWSHEGAGRYIRENAPVTISDYYERDPSRYTREAFPEMYE